MLELLALQLILQSLEQPCCPTPGCLRHLDERTHDAVLLMTMELRHGNFHRQPLQTMSAWHLHAEASQSDLAAQYRAGFAMK
jgi:hypothetical protein